MVGFNESDVCATKGLVVVVVVVVVVAVVVVVVVAGVVVSLRDAIVRWNQALLMVNGVNGS